MESMKYNIKLIRSMIFIVLTALESTIYISEHTNYMKYNREIHSFSTEKFVDRIKTIESTG